MPYKRTIPRTCEQCGTHFLANKYQVAKGHGRCCSKSCYAKQQVENPKYRYSDKDGYVMVPGKGQLRLREHRVIAETMLGRPLRADEVVHHINGVRDDNRPENLKVMSRSAHSRLHTIRDKQWSRQYRACIECGTTERPHNAHGLCWNCYKRLSRHAH